MSNLEAYFKDQFGYVPRTDGRDGKEFYRLACPNGCDYDGDYSRQLWVSKEKRTFRCWRCEKGGKGLIRLIMHLEQIPYSRAKKKAELYDSLYSADLEKEFEDIIVNGAGNEHIYTSKNEPDAVKQNFIPDGIVSIKPGSPGLKYLELRGFGEKEVKEWGLKYCASGRYRGRIMMPIYSPGGEYIRAWQGRAVSNRMKPPYLATSENEGDNVKGLLLNVHRARDPYILVEGWMDLLAVGPEHGICSLGKKLTEAQKRALRAARPREVVVLLDGDALADADNICNDLNCFCNSRVVELPYGEDPASLGRKMVWDVIKIGLSY